MPHSIKRLTLNNFRAFPGPNHHFELKGKNLLIYGENGAGKSSVFIALQEFFSLEPSRPLREYRNVFLKDASDQTLPCQVDVEFMDGSTATWDGTGHPGNIAAGNQSVKDAALYRSCLDYKSLLDTNFSHGPDEINLFDIAVQRLLHSYSVTVTGGTLKTVRELWNDVQVALQEIHRAGRVHGWRVNKINTACATFNEGFQKAIAVLPPHIKTILSDLLHADIDFRDFAFSGVTYNHNSRKLDGMSLTLPVQFRAYPLDRPQYFLNEARLSALGLAIYLAGRLACVPAGTMTDILKLMVLDDVLIGLDHSNRLPVLEVLQKHFSDWQIVLLTHDRVWFDAARIRLPVTEWTWGEVYENRDGALPAPVIRMNNQDAVAQWLSQADDFVNKHHYPAAASYARAALELTLKKFCDKKGVPVTYKLDSKDLNSNLILDCIKKWVQQNAQNWNGLNAKITAVETFRNIVLNPYSHSTPPTISYNEANGAITAVRDLRQNMSQDRCP